MRALKHAFLSLIRKPTKAVMIFVILFVVYGLVFTGLIIQNSVKSSKEYIRKELGAVVDMQVDIAKAFNQQLQPSEIKKISLPVSLAKEIAKDPLVKELYITQMTGVNNDDLESAMNLGQDSSGKSVSVRMGSDSGANMDFTLIGNSAEVPLEFSDGTYQISEGHLPGAEDAGKDTLMISEEFANKNNLSVGDFVDFTSTSDNQTYQFEIIGIFTGSADYAVDQMYTSLDSVQKISGTASTDNASAISFMLKDPLDVDKFIDQHKNQMPNDYIVLYADDSQYNSLTKPLDLISTITSILLVVVFIAGVIIMLAIITIFVRDRKFEIGLLLSNGEGRLKIISQFVMEILMVSVIAFGLAAGASQLSSKYVADWIVKNQLVEQDDTDTFTSMGKGNMFVMGRAASGASNTSTQVSISDVAKEFNVAVDADVIKNLLILSFGLVILSAGAPLIIILSYKPRQSLQD